MANYSQYDTQKNDSGDLMTVADLKLDGWSMPEYWTTNDEIPSGWPTTAVAALIHLFTGENLACAKDKGIDIPDNLAWHIATLIADWADYTDPINFPTDWDIPDLLTTMELEFPESLYVPATAYKLVRLKHKNQQVETTRYLVNHTRQWYGQGLDLFHQHQHRLRDHQEPSG